MSLYDALAHKIEVEVFMIVYMLQQDDGRITREEARVIKRHVRKHKVSLNDGEFQRIKELITEDLSIDTLVERIEQYQVSQKDIRKMFKRLYDVNKVTKRHDRIITFMRNHLAIQLDLDLSGIE
jgi:transcriptional regulator CtsR